MSLICRFYVVFMSLMAFRNAILLLHNQHVTIPFMSYVISFGHFNYCSVLNKLTKFEFNL